MRSIRLIASDLDGTLLRSDGTVSARTREAIRAAQAGGVRVVFVTARPPRDVRHLAGHAERGEATEGRLCPISKN